LNDRWWRFFCLSRLSMGSSGHCYLSDVDRGAKLLCIVFTFLHSFRSSLRPLRVCVLVCCCCVSFVSFLFNAFPFVFLFPVPRFRIVVVFIDYLLIFSSLKEPSHSPISSYILHFPITKAVPQRTCSLISLTPPIVFSIVYYHTPPFFTIALVQDFLLQVHPNPNVFVCPTSY